MNNKLFYCVTAALFVSCSLLAFGSSPQEQAVMPVVTEGYEHAKLLDKKLLNRMADNVELNVVSSTMTPEGKVLETVEEDGLVFKYMRDPQTPRPTWKQLVKGRVLPKAETGGDEISTEDILFESFEGAPGPKVDPLWQTWLPEGWESFSRVGNTFMPEDGSTTKIWRLSEGAISGVPDGRYLMWLNDEMESEFIGKSWHDEWLVSKPFTPDQYSQLEFYFWYCPAFMIDNVYDRNPTSTFKIHVSHDDGETWEEIWDIQDSIKNMTVQEINTNDGTFIRAVWHTYRFGISQFAGQNIRLAFHIESITGTSQSVALDRVVVRGPDPQASYLMPKGFFRWMYGPDLLFPSINSQMLTAALAPAYAECAWQNTSNDECDTFKWSFANPDGSDSPLTFTYAEPSMSYPYCQAPYPILEAANEVPQFTDSYQAAETGYGYVQYGGKAEASGLDMGVGTFDMNKGFGVGLVSEESDSCFLFGNGSRDNWQRYKLKGLANMFDKPVRPYLLKSVWVKAVNVSCADDAVLTLTVCRVDDYGNVYTSEPLAEATCYGYQIEEIYDDGRFKFYNIPFEITVFDKDLGLYVDAPLAISDQVLITIRGFDDTEMFPSIGVSYQANDHDLGENHAYVYVKPRNQPEEFYALPDLFGGQLSTSFNMSLNAIYPFMMLESGESTLAFGKGGGERSVTLNYYGLYGTFDEDCYISEIPDWVEVYEAGIDGTLHTIAVVADPLPDGMNSRSGEIVIESDGNAPLTLTVTQDLVTGIAQATSSQGIKVTRDGDNFTFTFGGCTYAAARVVSATGQVVGNIVADGNSCHFDASGLGNGIYFVQFTGDEASETLKIIK